MVFKGAFQLKAFCDFYEINIKSNCFEVFAKMIMWTAG